MHLHLEQPNPDSATTALHPSVQTFAYECMYVCHVTVRKVHNSKVRQGNTGPGLVCP